jgi:signal transduction histidine kinase
LISQFQNPPHDTAGRLEQSKAMLQQIDDAIHNVQEICSELRPTMLSHFGLSETIQWYLEEFEKQTGIRCKANIEPELPRLSEDLDILIFRIVQEAMTNVVRHARATKVTVQLKCERENLVLKIKDNGRGILKEEATHPKSFGIIGIRERVRFQGGRSKFEGVPNKGTTVTILLPLNRAHLADIGSTGPGENRGEVV